MLLCLFQQFGDGEVLPSCSSWEDDGGSKSILGSVGQECGPAVGTGVERMMVFAHL